MIGEVKMYGCTCDHCGESLVDNCVGFTAWVDECAVEDVLEREGWREVDGKWYCPKCFEKLFEEDEYGNIKRKEENE